MEEYIPFTIYHLLLKKQNYKEKKVSQHLQHISI